MDDSRADDYPLIRKKYALLLAIVPLFLFETEQLWSYFLNLKANIITSCCGSLFSTEGEGVGSAGLAALPAGSMQAIFFGVMAVTLVSGVCFLFKVKAGKLFAVAGTLAFPGSLAALVSFISVYFYELPTHHCPFCILQREYGYVGYPLYLGLLGGSVPGLGAEVLALAAGVPSLAGFLPGVMRRLVAASCALYASFAALTLAAVLASDLKL